ncbi:hypothetical protein SPRG_09830 [Saprolegnia parasitica CBS 223.65]|uniref:3-oxo-5-alpha-steroid 4-dehydrogenase C-terminal domain-containing protein n=1 Tax=Saprolegnia parasitica (strain CBS 223.65) TaxID=695850 RepID=A0A067C5L5_SAPPC|nr:hypothetical protein SPRG_09830 [Saprolegnia parasitica CBS 223.65]KDO24440.1 hypothetical protein SPRG_09830 [Saprolegnia parasitica CBS 223.65]|eukprot:XP_012204870.1 hypothetical protein SPRG_09830 [Saprolegnia parasitica CBS 223.65]
MDMMMTLGAAAWRDPTVASSILRGIWFTLSATALASLVLPPLHALSLHGRFASNASSWQVWKGYFGVFYLIGWLWNGLVLVCAWHPPMPIAPFLPPHLSAIHPSTLLVLVVLQCHLFRRMMESWAMTDFGASTMHASACLLGVGHYILVSLSVVLDPAASEDTTSIASVLAGLGLFLYASVHQMRCNGLLTNLKRASHGAYGLPFGDWFEHTWSPLYLAEILIYASFVLLTSGRHMNLVALAAWVGVNQAISAARAAAWYEATFPVAKTLHRATLLPRLW